VKSDSPNGVSISIQDLGKRFNREWIFRRLTFTFNKGNTYAITGPNGSGKSTLMQILWGQSLPSAGEIRYFSNEHQIPESEIFQQISIATPYMDLIDEFTLMEQVNFHFSIKQMRAGASTESIIDSMYLKSSSRKQIGNFSSGMRQRLKLGLAFNTDSQIIFLDEPGTNLDKQAFVWYTNQLRQIHPQTLVLIASNNPEEYTSASAVINIMDYK
jgi:ABC-type multidrug transport system ATPase subunit